MADDNPQLAPQTTPSTTEASNALMLNQVMGQLTSSLASGNTDVVALLNQIASAISADIIGGTTGVTANRALISKGIGGFALQASPVTIDAATGDVNTNGGDVTADNGIFSTSLTVGGQNVAITTQTIAASFTFKFPEDETVALILNSQFTWTITQTDTITEVGTSTVTVKIGTTALGGSSNSASTVLNTQAHSTNNSVASTNQVNVTFASTSSDCENLCLTIWGTRILAG